MLELFVEGNCKKKSIFYFQAHLAQNLNTKDVLIHNDHIALNGHMEVFDRSVKSTEMLRFNHEEFGTCLGRKGAVPSAAIGSQGHYVRSVEPLSQI